MIIISLVVLAVKSVITTIMSSWSFLLHKKHSQYCTFHENSTITFFNRRHPLCAAKKAAEIELKEFCRRRRRFLANLLPVTLFLPSLFQKTSWFIGVLTL